MRESDKYSRMYDEILLPVDESTTETAVLYHAAEFANATDADLTLLYVADTDVLSLDVLQQDVIDALEEFCEEVLEDTEGVLESLGVSPRTDVVQGTPAQTIVDYAESYDYDLVVMPTHGRQGLSRALLGSVTEKVVRLSTVPVLTARMREAEDLVFPYERVLVPVDGSDPARHAAQYALDLASVLDATVHVLSVVNDTHLGMDVGSSAVEEALQAAAEETVESIEANAADAAPDVDVRTHVDRGAPARTILEYVDDLDVHAVVMGTTGRRSVARVLLGSVAEKTVRTAPVPVVTVPRPDA